MKQSRSDVELDGIVMPAEWNEEGDVVEVKLCTAGEHEYLIEGDKKGRRLLGHLKARVRVSGEVYLDSEGAKRLQIKAFHFKE